jgi:arabinogalactan endo-1,4-beta-galactosidase
LNIQFLKLTFPVKLYFLLFVAASVNLHAQPFYFGADLSYVNEMEDCGAVFKENGESKDSYSIFKDQGCNLVRVRLWHTPSWYDALNQGNRYSDFADVANSISRAKSLGLHALLDFHLSDTWADPSHQVVPAAWASVVNNLPVLQDSLYQYIYNTLTQLSASGLLPEMVQIGNETNKGILLSQQVNDQGWSVNWPRNAALFNSAIDAVRDVESETGSTIKVALHIADPSELDWWMEQFWTNGVQDFDIIGVSYYHQYHDELFPEVGDAISDMKATYPGKAVMILETGYPWTTGFDDNANNLLHTVYPGYPFSPANQKEWLVDLAQVVIDHGGSGVVYWEPAWVSTGCFTRFGKGSNWENCTFFDFETNLLNNGGAGWMSHAYDFTSATNEILPKKNSLQIQQADHEIILRRDNELLFNEEMDVEFHTLDGKFLSRQTYFPIWENNRFHVNIPNLSSGCFLITCILSGQQPVNQLFFKN